MRPSRPQVVRALTIASVVAFVVGVAGCFVPSLVPMTDVTAAQFLVEVCAPLLILASVAFIVVYVVGRALPRGRVVRIVLLVIGILQLAYFVFMVASIVYFAVVQPH